MHAWRVVPLNAASSTLEWLAELAQKAAGTRSDGGVSLLLLMHRAGFTREPKVTYIIRRERVAF